MSYLKRVVDFALCTYDKTRWYRLEKAQELSLLTADSTAPWVSATSKLLSYHIFHHPDPSLKARLLETAFSLPAMPAFPRMLCTPTPCATGIFPTGFVSSHRMVGRSAQRATRALASASPRSWNPRCICLVWFPRLASPRERGACGVTRSQAVLSNLTSFDPGPTTRPVSAGGMGLYVHGERQTGWKLSMIIYTFLGRKFKTYCC
jgi:hypothetical protein